MEGVMSVSDLLQAVRDIENPCEALIRAFNILCPYDEKLAVQSESLRTVS